MGFLRGPRCHRADKGTPPGDVGEMLIHATIVTTSTFTGFLCARWGPLCQHAGFPFPRTRSFETAEFSRTRELVYPFLLKAQFYPSALEIIPGCFSCWFCCAGPSCCAPGWARCSRRDFPQVPCPLLTDLLVLLFQVRGHHIAKLDPLGISCVNFDGAPVTVSSNVGEN